MKTKTPISILIFATASRNIVGKLDLLARITVSGQRASISIVTRISKKLWDHRRKRLIGNSPEAKRGNFLIEQTRSRLFDIYQELYYKEKLVTAKLIKAKYFGEGQESKTLVEILKYHNNKIEKVLSDGTIRNFAVTEGYIYRFLKDKKKTDNVYLKELNYKFITDFEMYLIAYYPKGHPKAMSHNTVMKHIQRLRKIVTLAYHIEWLDKDPFVRWKPTFEKTRRDFLNANELSNIETYEFKLERLERVRDLFVFSCYTGISYSDLIKLTADNIVIGMDGNKWIMTKRQKTGTPVKVPLLEVPERIIEKYCNHPVTSYSGTLLPVISNEKVNLYLKEIADAVGIKKNLTFHMSRHTFATTVTLSNGVPIETVSKLLGHTKLATTQIYARVLDTKISEDMNTLRNKLSSEKESKSSISRQINI